MERKLLRLAIAKLWFRYLVSVELLVFSTVADYGKCNVNVALREDVQKSTSHLIEMLSCL